MKPITIYTRHFPPSHFSAITLFPFIFHNHKHITDSELRHETVHFWQEVSLLIVFFYLLYLIFWLYNIIRYHDKTRAYYEIPFERSAYTLESREDLTVKEMIFDWTHRIRTK